MRAFFLVILFLIVGIQTADAGLVISPASDTTIGTKSYITVCDEVGAFLPSGSQLVGGLILSPSGAAADSDSIGLPSIPSNCRWVEVTGMSTGELKAFFGSHETVTELDASVGVSSDPVTASVPATTGLVPMQCSDPQSCGSCEFVSMVNNVIQFIIAELLPLVAVAMFVYAGFLMVIARGDTDTLATARKIFGSVGLGIIIVLAAFLIVNVIMSIMLGDRGLITNWTQLTCVYPNEARDLTFEFAEPTYEIVDADGNVVSTYVGGGSGGGGSCTPATSGPCSADALRDRGWGDLADDAASILSMESGCNSTAESGSDTTAGGGSYSVGTWQINLAANAIQCTTNDGQRFDLNCPSAYTDTGERNSLGVRIQQEENPTLAAECRRIATTYPECNEQIALRLARASGDMGDWACSARRCGIYTSRNHLCPL